MKTCYIYARTATTTQQEQAKGVSNAIAHQLQECQRYAEKQSYKVLKIFTEVASGNNYKRDALQQLLANCKNHPVDAVIILRIDRLSRNATNYQKIRIQLEKSDTKLLSVYEGDLNNGVGKFMGNILAAFAQYETKRSVAR